MDHPSIQINPKYRSQAPWPLAQKGACLRGRESKAIAGVSHPAAKGAHAYLQSCSRSTSTRRPATSCSASCKPARRS